MYYVYILTNQSNKVLYTGITNDLERRLYEHQNKLIKGFTSKYNVNKLVYFDCTTEATSAIAREKQIKGWTRQKKLDLISELNPQWRDLSADW
jgi:putative endonuclease